MSCWHLPLWLYKLSKYHCYMLRMQLLLNRCKTDFVPIIFHCCYFSVILLVYRIVRYTNIKIDNLINIIMWNELWDLFCFSLEKDFKMIYENLSSNFVERKMSAIYRLGVSYDQWPLSNLLTHSQQLNRSASPLLFVPTASIRLSLLKSGPSLSPRRVWWPSSPSSRL